MLPATRRDPSNIQWRQRLDLDHTQHEQKSFNIGIPA
jgi:hypothetical protein